MQVIPVLDLKGGVVVLAAGGKRDSYRPIDTLLCPDPSPAAVVAALLAIFRFKRFYLAELDAIEGVARNGESAIQLAQAYPDIEFWIDAGFAEPDDLTPFEGMRNIRYVIGSESLGSIETYETMRRDTRMADHILSLDRKDGLELGPQTLIHRPQLWPDTIISMDLTQVGRAAGPNLTRIRELRDRREDLTVVAAGGVRNIDDLLSLAAEGASYALVATALHNRNLTEEDLARLSRRSA
jgi:phosphoribosylformimino-5-aminoimidazole carboxamide ribotide isomerase